MAECFPVTIAIGLSWVVPAHSLSEAARNEQEVSKMATFQYPGFQDNGPLVTTINTPPLVRVLFMNKIIRAGGSPAGSAKTSGLLCRVNGWNPSFDIDQGGFTPQAGLFFPKSWNCSLSLTVLHEHSLGWNGNRLRRGSKGFPYSMETFREAPPIATSDRVPDEIKQAQENAVSEALDAFDIAIGTVTF